MDVVFFATSGIREKFPQGLSPPCNISEGASSPSNPPPILYAYGYENFKDLALIVHGLAL